MFTTLWTRYSADIKNRWDLDTTEGNNEHPRPQYLAKLANWKKFKINYITNTIEPDPSCMMKWPRYICSVSVVFLLVMLNVAAVLAIIMYRISVRTAFSMYGGGGSSFAIMISSAIINLILMYLLSFVSYF